MGKRWAHKFFTEVVVPYNGDECLLWPFAAIKGYAVLRVDGKLEYVHRLLCEGVPEGDKVQALHRCGNGAQGCVTRRHLYWGSPQDNVDDTLKHGRRNRGNRNGSAVLTEDQVREIKGLLQNSGMTRAAIGERYGVSREAINEIAWKNNWGWLE